MKTKVVNIRYDKYDVYIGRPGKGKEGEFGNPIVKYKKCPECGKVHANNGSTIKCFEKYFLRRINQDEKFKKKVIDLKGKILGCFCKPNECHGDVIAKWCDNYEVNMYGCQPCTKCGSKFRWKQKDFAITICDNCGFVDEATEIEDDEEE